MTLRTILSVATVAVVAASSLAASQTKPVDLSGTWTGTFTSITTTGEPDEDPAYLVLVQKGDVLTGTGGPAPGEQMPIRNGKVTTVKDVTTAVFEITEHDTLIKFDVKLVGGRLKGQAQADVDGRKREAALDVGRAK